VGSNRSFIPFANDVLLVTALEGPVGNTIGDEIPFPPFPFVTLFWIVAVWKPVISRPPLVFPLKVL
jgi:hypothetical protein